MNGADRPLPSSTSHSRTKEALPDLPRSRLFTADELLELYYTVEQNTGISFSSIMFKKIEHSLDELVRSTGGASTFLSELKTSQELMQKMVDLITVGESYFFRNRPHMRALKERILPALIKECEPRKRISIWSAGCACGEEPFSILMLIKDRFPALESWQIDLVGADINRLFLERAEEGCYSKWALREMEPRLIERYFSIEEGDRYRLSRAVADKVRFLWFNLGVTPYFPRLKGAVFDLVLCRNVLIYFSPSLAQQSVKAFSEVIRPGGFLMVGHSEPFLAFPGLEICHTDSTFYYRWQGRQAAALESKKRPKTRTRRSRRLKEIPDRDKEQANISLPAPAMNPPVALVSEKAPVSKDAMVQEALACADRGQAEEAMKKLEAMVGGQYKLDGRTHFLLGLVADHLGRSEEAVSSLKRAVYLDKNLIVAHFYLGVFAERTEDHRQARRRYTTVMDQLASISDLEEVRESGRMTAGRLREIVKQRLDRLGDRSEG